MGGYNWGQGTGVRGTQGDKKSIYQIEPANITFHAMRRPAHRSFIATAAPVVRGQGEPFPDIAGDVYHVLHLFGVV